MTFPSGLYGLQVTTGRNTAIFLKFWALSSDAGSIPAARSTLPGFFGVTTGHLNKAVKRNPRRFPPDFMFQLTEAIVGGHRAPLQRPEQPVEGCTRQELRLSGQGRKFDDVCCVQFGLGRGARREHPPPVGL